MILTTFARAVPIHADMVVLLVETSTQSGAELVQAALNQASKIAVNASRIRQCGETWVVTASFERKGHLVAVDMYHELAARCHARAPIWAIVAVYLDERGLSRRASA